MTSGSRKQPGGLPEDRSEMPQSVCRRCGTCCENGGPALHTPDLDLIRNGQLDLEDLITIRKGEMAQDPVRNRPVRIPEELVKLRGTAGSWKCLYFSRSKGGCTIYDHRPLACRILQCWNPDAALDISGKDLLSRLDILEADHPLRQAISDHDRMFSCDDVFSITRAMPYAALKKRIKKLEKQVNQEIALRHKIIATHRLSLLMEQFLFGRPLFKLAQSIGCTVRETPAGLRIERPR